MTRTELAEIAKKHEWWSEECPAKWQYCYWAYSFVEQRAYFHPDYLSVCAVTIRNEFGQEKTSVEEKLATYDWIKAQYVENRGWFDDEYDRWVRVRSAVNALDAEIAIQADGWSRTELRENYNRLLPLAIDSTRWGVVIEATDPYSERIIPEKLNEVYPELSDDERNTINVTLSTPLIVSFMEEYELEKLHILEVHRDELLQAATYDELNATGELAGQIDSLRLAYQWLTVNYAGSAPLTNDGLFVQLQEDAAHRSHDEVVAAIQEVNTKIERTQAHQDEVLAAHPLPQDLLDDFSIMREIGRWMDERKETMVRTNLALYVLLEAIAQETNVPKGEVEWYTIAEIDALLGDDVRVSSEEIDARKTNAVFVTEYDGDNGSTLTIFTGDDATALYAEFNATSSEVLQGMVAARGKDGAVTFTGEVQVILDTEAETFIPGNILVTTMTRPDFVPLLKKAAAIVTDEGGVTCHAAVVSRELGIPCIIGTRHATKQLEDGQRVEMNLENGEVRLT